MLVETPVSALSALGRWFSESPHASGPSWAMPSATLPAGADMRPGTRGASPAFRRNCSWPLCLKTPDRADHAEDGDEHDQGEGETGAVVDLTGRRSPVLRAALISLVLVLVWLVFVAEDSAEVDRHRRDR